MLFSAWHQALFSFICAIRKGKFKGYIPIPSHLCTIILLKQDWVKEHYTLVFLLWAKKWTTTTKHTQRQEKSPLHVQAFHCKLLVYYGISNWMTYRRQKWDLHDSSDPSRSVCVCSAVKLHYRISPGQEKYNRSTTNWTSKLHKYWSWKHYALPQHSNQI